ncbi:protein of unknown function DUF262 [Desulfofarcimen acetoxidans DSM 771]|uniref:GmrSD restriction endonucleases N-terminal domain-containing protein n=1 Tax=Desulfofarcimen acetoxidans (strain ATCC 49208 / DSM 771 / KCTC 5769 / VKM B-1644 / 5575) TaxID=485916 RepID=C8VVU7_DESAS|nr:DUF262 domain-containing protein [Desulfofarcimen acetoxidans]ACV64234.1 protein of unknown function DUF262 [Desulfofarcimen acetoxidans DSM 771]
MLMQEYDEFEFIGEENEEDLIIQDINRFSESVIWGTDWTIETMISQLKKGNIDLNPKFQRRDAWGEEDKSRLIESLILGIPVPPIIIAEHKKQRNKYIVIDGKQRLLSLRQFAADNNDEFNNLKLKGLQFLKELNGYKMEQIEEDYNLNPWLRNFLITQ